MIHRTVVVLALVCLIAGCAQTHGQEKPATQYATLERPGTPPPPEEVGDPDATNVTLPRYPSISPDGKEVVFSWRGDLWKVGIEGGAAARLTSHPADDLRSAWSRDGERIVFESTRNGFENIHIMGTDGSGVRRVSDTDGGTRLSSFDEEGITLSSYLEGDPVRSRRPYLLSPSGGGLERIHDAFGTQPVIHRDGDRIAFVRGAARTTRRHYRGAASYDIWMYRRKEDAFTRLTTFRGNDMQPRWVGESDLLFLSDRELSCVNLYRMDSEDGGSGATRLTDFQRHDVQFFDVSADGKTAVLHVWGTLYSLALDDEEAKAVPMDILAPEDEQDRFNLQAIDAKATEAALSPDGKTMACVAYGEVYVRNIEEKSPTQRVTKTHARESGIAWSPDGLKLYFASDSDGTVSIYAATVALTRKEVKEEFEKATNPPEEEEEEKEEEEEEKPEEEGDKEEDDKDKDKKKEKKDLPKELQPQRWQDAIRFDIQPVIQTEHHDSRPLPSPDGKSLAFVRGRGDLMVLDIESGESRVLVPGWDTDIDARWSPDSRHIAYVQSDLDFNQDIWIVPADGGEKAVNITRHPNDETHPRWSADGKILAFLSRRINDESDAWMVYLDADLETLTPKEMEKYYQDAVDAAKKRKPLKVENPEEEKEEKEEKKEEPEELDLEDAYLRLKRITSLSGDEGDLELTPGGDRFIFSATIGEAGVYSVKWDGEDRKSLGKGLAVQHVSLTGDKVVVLSGGKAATVPPAGGKLTTVGVSDRMLIDLEEQSSQKFLEAARIVGAMFYHPTLKGLDWPKLTEEYHALAKEARTANEFNEVANRFIGELNGSHLGITTRGETSRLRQDQGRLGTVHKRVEDGFEVTQVVPHSPADMGSMALEVGDVITAIDGAPFQAADTIESRLTGMVGKEVLLTVRRTLDEGEASLDLLITPIGSRQERQLKYRALRRERADLVSQWSDGRVGYIHIQSMSQPALDVFERDLFAAAEGKDGLIIDVRDNSGGWTTDRLLSSIMVTPHAYTVPRGADPQKTGHYPEDRLFIQRYTLPMNLLCNEKSFSNAEIISHAFKTLERGTLVGQETYGAVISTGGTTLIDGTFVRLPFRGWFLPDGTDMEAGGAVPDIIVEQTPGSEAKGEDPQLRAAVDDLLERL